MERKKNELTPGSISSASFTYLLLTISGLSFCFFLGFPFDNHNESFLWITILDKVNLWDTLTSQVIKIESFRPLGMANAWLSYRLSGNIYLQQILNWLFATASFVLLFITVKNKKYFSLLSFVTCVCFFTGYIYLFHLHGVFYGPFQLYVAALTCIAYQRRSLSGKMLAAISVTTLVICLYHTFALLIFCAFIAGYIMQLTKNDKRTAFIRLGTVLVLTVVLAKTILQAKEFKTIQALADGFLASYKMAEVNKGLALMAATLSVLAAMSLIKSATGKIMAGVAVVLLSSLFMYLHLPVLILWAGICLFKMLINKNFAMAALIAATAILPLGSGSGSPTYVVFVLMICAFVTASNDDLIIPDYPFLKNLTLFSVLILFGCLLALKAGLQVPLLFSVAKPILAEQEKTHQLKDIIAWKLKSKEYAAFGLTLTDSVRLPVNSNNAISRTHRPVAGQEDINEYIDFFSKDSIPNSAKPAAIYVTFGNKILPGRHLVYSVNGTWNGKASVFR